MTVRSYFAAAGMAVASQIGANVVITCTANDVITLQNVTLSNLQAEHFVFF